MENYLGRFFQRADGGPILKVVAFAPSIEVFKLEFINSEGKKDLCEIDFHDLECHYEEVAHEPMVEWKWLDGHFPADYDTKEGDGPW